LRATSVCRLPACRSTRARSASAKRFFAIRGYRLDGHAFLADAASRGAACLVVHTLHDDVPANVPLVLVEDTTKALGLLAAYHRARFSIPVVAVTGSNGKTTTKELIAGVLGTRWNVLKPSGSFNNQCGPAADLAQADAGAPGARARDRHPAPRRDRDARRAGRPTISVVTTVAHAHTEFLGSLDAVRDEKAELVKRSRRTATPSSTSTTRAWPAWRGTRARP
jgi:UDP-N-acetylmuramyl pentapeptide synthase